MTNKPTWIRFPQKVYSTINSMYSDTETIPVKRAIVDQVIVDGLKYGFNSGVNSLVHFKNRDHWFENLKPNDICLDIGACIGAFTIPAATKAGWVYAIEPLWYKELELNKKLNTLDNITVLNVGIGNGMPQHIQFGEHEEIVETISMKSLIGSLPNINVAKIDCEGAEWAFEPSMLKGIREIHFEFHIRRTNQREDWQKYDDYMKWFLNNYQTEIIVDNRNLGWTCPFVANIGVRAVK